MRAARRCGRGSALARRAPRSCAYYTRHERADRRRHAPRGLLDPARRIRDRSRRHRACAVRAAARRGRALRPGRRAGRRRIFHLRVRRRVSDGAARTHRADARQAADARSRRRAGRRAAAARRGVAARGRVLGRAAAHARYRSHRRRPAQGQACVPRSDRREPRRTHRSDDGCAPPGTRAGGAARDADRRARSAATDGGVRAALGRVIRTLPVVLRNRLAATILDAVGAARARRASDALATLPPATAHAGLDAVLDTAARLYEAGLYFEVHEWLEPHWIAASGETREALQGVIQTAVGWQHLANDNVAGARSLLVDGAARLRGRRLGARGFDAFARATAAAADRLPSAAPPPFPVPERDASEREESL